MALDIIHVLTVVKIDKILKLESLSIQCQLLTSALINGLKHRFLSCDTSVICICVVLLFLNLVCLPLKL
jgi:hypothetical protein